MKNLSIKLSWVFFFAFLASGLLALIPNPILGENGFFVTNFGHNLVHFTTAVAFVVVALLGERASINFMLGFGVIYAIVGFVGFTVTSGSSHGMLLGFIHINTMDNFLHLGLGAAIFAGGIISRKMSSLNLS